MIICTTLTLEGAMETLVLHFRNNRQPETLRFPLPRHKVLERDEEGRATKVEGPFINGKIRANIIYNTIEKVMAHYYGPEALAGVDFTRTLIDEVATFEARVKGNDLHFRQVLADIREWADKALACDASQPGGLDAYLLRRSVLRVLNSFASGRTMDDSDPTDHPDPEDLNFVGRKALRETLQPSAL